jgi:hypothetical protein
MFDGAVLRRGPLDVVEMLKTATCACDAGVEATKIAKVVQNKIGSKEFHHHGRLTLRPVILEIADLTNRISPRHQKVHASKTKTRESTLAKLVL